MTKKKTAKKKSDFFYNTFIGEFVQVIAKFNSATVEEGTVATVSGYLLDIDDEWLFLGPTADAVSASIKREDVMSVQIMPKFDKHTEILKELSTPDNKDSGN